MQSDERMLIPLMSQLLSGGAGVAFMWACVFPPIENGAPGIRALLAVTIIPWWANPCHVASFVLLLRQEPRWAVRFSLAAIGLGLLAPLYRNSYAPRLGLGYDLWLLSLILQALSALWAAYFPSAESRDDQAPPGEVPPPPPQEDG